MIQKEIRTLKGQLNLMRNQATWVNELKKSCVHFMKETENLAKMRSMVVFRDWSETRVLCMISIAFNRESTRLRVLIAFRDSTEILAPVWYTLYSLRACKNAKQVRISRHKQIYFSLKGSLTRSRRHRWEFLIISSSHQSKTHPNNLLNREAIFFAQQTTFSKSPWPRQVTWTMAILSGVVGTTRCNLSSCRKMTSHLCGIAYGNIWLIASDWCHM